MTSPGRLIEGPSDDKTRAEMESLAVLAVELWLAGREPRIPGVTVEISESYEYMCLACGANPAPPCDSFTCKSRIVLFEIRTELSVARGDDRCRYLVPTEKITQQSRLPTRPYPGPAAPPAPAHT